MTPSYRSVNRAVWAAAVTVLAGVAGALAPAYEAHAGTKVKACPALSICLYQDTKYGGEMRDIQVEGLGGWALTVGWMNDRTTSIVNNSAVSVAVYQDPQQTNNDGACAIVAPHASIPNVGSFWNDRISMIFSNTDECYYGAHRRSIP